MSQIDLHCHSTQSDGLLRPQELVARAAERGVKVLALTDHDETGGLAEARACAEAEGIAFVTSLRSTRATRGASACMPRSGPTTTDRGRATGISATCPTYPLAAHRSGSNFEC